VLLNAAAALIIAGKAPDLRTGAALAAEAIDGGAAAAVLERLRHATQPALSAGPTA
jgi:anthranilate phosphoribosyltransferase